MISSLAWVPRGAAKAEPDYAEIAEDDAEAMIAAQLADAQAASDEDTQSLESEDEGNSASEDNDDEDMDEDEDEKAAVAKAEAFAAVIKSSSGAKSSTKAGDSLAAAMAELDMENYDNDDENDDAVRRILGSGNPGMAYHRDPADDPYLKNSRVDDDDDNSEAEDLRINDSDLLILAVRNDEDVSHLEMWVYEEADERGDGNLYVHHAIMLPAFPLSLAWLDVDPSGKRERGNFAAVGSFEPGIEIWDMDVLDAVEPVATLGGADYEATRKSKEASNPKKKEKKNKKKNKGSNSGSKAPEIVVKPGSHSDAVLGLAWNIEYRNVLASASADTTVKVWDISTCTPSHTLEYHTDKVQSVAWNPVEAPILLSGGFDKKVCMADMRTPSPSGGPATWQTPADVEALAWDPHNPTCFAVSSENGEVLFFDTRRGAGCDPLLRLSAHNKAASALAFNPAVKGLVLTASTDKKVKLWGVDLASGGGGGEDGSLSQAPRMLASVDLHVGAVFSASFCRDAPLVLAAGGAKGEVTVWDTSNTEAVVNWAKSMSSSD